MNREIGYGRPPAETRFAPGRSGNPNGRPKGRSLTAILREALDSRTLKGKPIPGDRTVAEVLADVIIAQALKGKLPFIREILDRTEGKPRQAIDLSGQANGPPWESESFKQALARAYGKPEDYLDEVREMSDQQLHAIVAGKAPTG